MLVSIPWFSSLDVSIYPLLTLTVEINKNAFTHGQVSVVGGRGRLNHPQLITTELEFLEPRKKQTDIPEGFLNFTLIKLVKKK